MTNSLDFHWPSHPENFKNVMTQGFQLFENLAQFCLTILAQGMKRVPKEYFVEMLDELPLPSNAFSNSLLTIYQYSQMNQEAVSIHKVKNPQKFLLNDNFSNY